MLKKKYVLYGLSILIGRGAEFGVLFLLGIFFTKSDYGQIEYWKKMIEIFSVFFSFGFPIILLTYSKNEEEKNRYYLYGIVAVFFFMLISSPLFYLNNLSFLLLPIAFHAIFAHSGSLTQTYHLLNPDSNYPVFYKLITALLTASGLLLCAFVFHFGIYSYVVTLTALIIIYSFYLVFLFRKIVSLDLLRNILEIKTLFSKSFYIVFDSVFNLAFFASDIFLIKLLLQKNEALEGVANYSFPLNIASLLMMVSMVIVQMEMNSLKKDHIIIKEIARKVDTFLIVAIVFLITGYWLLITYYAFDYGSTFTLFLILVMVKFFQSSSMTHGNLCLIKGYYKKIFFISVISFIGNILFGYLTFSFLGIYGIALSSFLFVFLRFYIFRFRLLKNS